MSYIQDMFNILTVNCPNGTRTVISRAKLVELQALSKLQKHSPLCFFNLFYESQKLCFFTIGEDIAENKKIQVVVRLINLQ